MFASKSILEHLVRGVVGLGGIAVAMVLLPTHPWLSLGALPVALIALRGCPMCWTVGLVQTVVARVKGKRAIGACVDGSCALKI